MNNLKQGTCEGTGAEGGGEKGGVRHSLCFCEGGRFRLSCVKALRVWGLNVYVYDACSILLCVVSVCEARCASPFSFLAPCLRDAHD